MTPPPSPLAAVLCPKRKGPRPKRSRALSRLRWIRPVYPGRTTHQVEEIVARDYLLSRSHAIRDTPDPGHFFALPGRIVTARRRLSSGPNQRKTVELKAGPAQNTNLNPNCIWRGILTVARISRNPDCPESRSADRRTGGSQRVSSDGQRRQDVVAVRIRRAVSRGATRGRRCHECTGHDTGARIGHAGRRPCPGPAGRRPRSPSTGCRRTAARWISVLPAASRPEIVAPTQSF